MTPLPEGLTEIFLNKGEYGFNAISINDASKVSDLKQKHENIAIGVKLDLTTDLNETYKVFDLISVYKAEIKKIYDNNDIDFLYIYEPSNFCKTRAAVIAASDLTGINATVALEVFADNKMEDGTDILAAVNTLESMGVGTFVLFANDPLLLSDATEYIAPYIKSTICIKLSSQDLLYKGLKLYNTELYCPSNLEEFDSFKKEVNNFSGNYFITPEEDDIIPCSDSREIHFLYPETDISDEIQVTSRFPEEIIEAEDLEAGAFKLEITSEEEISILEEYQYMLNRPICIVTYDEELLEKSLRVFKGRSIYDGTFKINDIFLKYLEGKYGLIVL